MIWWRNNRRRGHTQPSRKHSGVSFPNGSSTAHKKGHHEIAPVRNKRERAPVKINIISNLFVVLLRVSIRPFSASAANQQARLVTYRTRKKKRLKTIQTADGHSSPNSLAEEIRNPAVKIAQEAFQWETLVVLRSLLLFEWNSRLTTSIANIYDGK